MPTSQHLTPDREREGHSPPDVLPAGGDKGHCLSPLVTLTSDGLLMAQPVALQLGIYFTRAEIWVWKTQLWLKKHLGILMSKVMCVWRKEPDILGVESLWGERAFRGREQN